MPDFFWIVVVLVVVSNVVKAVRRSSGRGRGGGDRRPTWRDVRATAWEPPVPPDNVTRPQREPPSGGWPLGRGPDEFSRFRTLGAPAGHVGPVTTRRATFTLAGRDVRADLALFTWSWYSRDDGRWKPRELPVAMVRLPADMPELLLVRPGRGVDWAGVVRRPDRFSVDHAWAIEPDDLRHSSLFTPEFAASMASLPRLVFEARGDLLVVAPAEPRAVPRPGVVTGPPPRLDAAATRTDDELPTLAELVARLLGVVPDGWWHHVLADVDRPRGDRTPDDDDAAGADDVGADDRGNGDDGDRAVEADDAPSWPSHTDLPPPDPDVTR